MKPFINPTKKELLLWAGIWTAALAFAFLVPLGVHAQEVNCNGIVALDEAHVFGDSSRIANAASGLIDQGADVHVVSTNMGGVSSLSQVETKLEGACPSWTAAGHRKPNLFVLIVSPLTHKKNVFFGGAYTPVLPTEDSVNVLYSQAANPFFKQGDFAGGMIAALKDFSAKVAAYHDQQRHPVVAHTEVVNQATDLHGFWVVMGWIVALTALGIAIWAIVALIGSARRRKAAVASAQASAMNARDRAIKFYQSIPPTASLGARLLELTNSISNDPSMEGLTAEEYNTIRDRWNDFASDCNTAAVPDSSYAAEAPRKKRHPKHKYPGGYEDNSRAAYTPYPSSATPATPSYAPNSGGNTVIVHDNSNDMLTGVLLGEALSEPRERDVYIHDEPRYSPPAPSYDPPSSSGSDSSWSSSDDSSSSGSDSSYSDSSSSSDFGGSGGDSSW